MCMPYQHTSMCIWGVCVMYDWVDVYNPLKCFPFQLLLFVMSSAVDGMMTTKDQWVSELINRTSRADLLCQKDAERAGLWGTYSALLSTKQRPIRNITTQRYHHLPIVNTKVSGHFRCKHLFMYRMLVECVYMWIQGYIVKTHSNMVTCPIASFLC